MFLQYLLSNFDTLEDISKPISYGEDIVNKTRPFSTIEDACYLFALMRRAQKEITGTKAAAAAEGKRSPKRDPVASVYTMIPTYKRYISVYDEEDDFI